MDPLSAALIAAITAGLARGGGEVSQKVLVEGYQRLKKLLADRFGGDVVQAVEELESRPDSGARQGVLVEEVAHSGAGQDDEIKALAHALLTGIRETQVGSGSVQQAVGSYIAQADRQSYAEVHVNDPKP